MAHIKYRQSKIRIDVNKLNVMYPDQWMILTDSIYDQNFHRDVCNYIFLILLFNMGITLWQNFKFLLPKKTAYKSFYIQCWCYVLSIKSIMTYVYKCSVQTNAISKT